MDVASFHKTETVLKKPRNRKVTLAPIPPGCTSDQLIPQSTNDFVTSCLADASYLLWQLPRGSSWFALDGRSSIRCRGDHAFPRIQLQLDEASKWSVNCGIQRLKQTRSTAERVCFNRSTRQSTDHSKTGFMNLPAAGYVETMSPTTPNWSVRQERIMTTYVVAATARNELAARCESFIECGMDHSYR